METAACACETTECAKDKFCFVKSGTGYVFDTAACAKSDASAKETAACTCGYKAGAIAAVAKDEYCFVAADGTGTKVADPPCKKTDASAAEDPKCSCNGADSIVAVAKDKFCRVVAKKGYVVDKVKCSNTAGSAAVTAECTCGYKTTMVTVAKDKFCFEDTAGKGYVADNKQCSALSATQADGSTIASAACTCGTTAVAAQKVGDVVVGTCGFCFDDDNYPVGYVGKAAMSACSKTDGSTAHATAPERCICGTSACANGKFCFAASAGTKCKATALPLCSAAAANQADGSTAAAADCKCGTTQALAGKFCIASKNAVNTAALAKCAGTDGKTVAAAGVACSCDASADVCTAGQFCDKTAAGTGNSGAKGKCLTTAKASPTPSTPSTPATPATPASSYTSAAASPAPAPPHFIEAELKLTGITVAQFDNTAKANFKSVIAASMTGVKASDVYDVKATAATRRAGVKVSFKVKVATAAAASSGATTLNTFLNDTTGANGFLKKLKAKGGALANVSGVTVTKAPAAKTSVTVTKAPA